MSEKSISAGWIGYGSLELVNAPAENECAAYMQGDELPGLGVKIFYSVCHHQSALSLGKASHESMFHVVGDVYMYVGICLRCSCLLRIYLMVHQSN